MKKQIKEYKALNIKIDKSLMERFEDYCNVKGQTKTTAIERILYKHLDEFDQEDKRENK